MMPLSFIFLIVLLCISTTVQSLNTFGQTIGDLQVTTTEGQVKGFVNSAGVRVWRGIRYAQAPTGNLRFANPVAPQSFSPNVYPATVSPPGCPQFCSLPAGMN